MKYLRDKKKSLYIQMTALLIVAAMTACVFIIFTDNIAQNLLDKYLENSDYINVNNRKLIEEFQNYITIEHVCSRDSGKINRWIQNQPLLSVSIFKDGIQVFDSNYPDHEIWDDEISFINYDWMSYETIEFSDGSAEIEIAGAYRYRFSNSIRTIEIGLGFVIFLLIIIAGIRKKMNYIRLLSREVEILEAGGLDYQITVRGKDELSMLAEGLDCMRLSFLDSRGKEEELVRNNQRIITEMSHDLRTPITSILLYAEIMIKNTNSASGQQIIYLKKIKQKALLIKTMTDRLFEYSLKPRVDNTEMETAPFKDVLFDPLSDAISFLEQRNYRVVAYINWTKAQIAFNDNYVARIIDNIVSNIVKYANKQEAITISGIEDNNMIGLRFINHTATGGDDHQADSTGIGLQSIYTMINEMGGKCRYSCTGPAFRIDILFRSITKS